VRANLPIGSTSPTTQRNGNWFARLAVATSRISGRPATFLLAAVVLVWAVTGPMFGFSDTWQLVINTGTTIVTFLMVFLIQATQNRDTLALQLKLDELIMATKNARNHIAGIEDASDEEIGRAKVEMHQRGGKASGFIGRRDRPHCPPACDVPLPVSEFAMTKTGSIGHFALHATIALGAASFRNQNDVATRLHRAA